jgi:hypothetical protein
LLLRKIRASVLSESRYRAHLFGAPLRRRCTVLISHKMRVTAPPRAVRTRHDSTVAMSLSWI